MKQAMFATGALGAVLFLVGLGWSGEDKDLRALVNKGLEANGGAAKLAKFKAQTLKGTGKFYGTGDEIDYTLEVNTQEHKQLRVAVDMKVNDFDVRFRMVVSGDKGWEKVNDDVKDMAADEVAEHKEQMYCDAVATLLPLTGKEYKLSALGEVKVEGADAVGVRVSREGRRDVNLYFDKAKGHLVKSEYQVKDLKADKELIQTTYYSEYKEFQGTRHPTHLVTERDGKKFTDTQLSEIQMHEDRLPDSIFGQP